MKAKKMLSLVFAIIMMFSAYSTVAFADYDLVGGQDDLFSNEAMIDFDFISIADIYDANGALIAYKTTELSTDAANSTTDYASYMTKIAVFQPKEEFTVKDVHEELQEYIDRAASGSKTETDRDSSISIEGYITIYYDRTTQDGSSYVRITEVSGGYTRLDRQVKVKSQNINVGCSGWALGYGWVDQSDDFSESSASWTYTAPDDWIPVSTNDGPTIFAGANCTYTLQRIGNDHTWELYIENNL